MDQSCETVSCPECGSTIHADDEVRGVGGSCVMEHEPLIASRCTCTGWWKGHTWTANGPTPHMTGCPHALGRGYASVQEAHAQLPIEAQRQANFVAEGRVGVELPHWSADRLDPCECCGENVRDMDAWATFELDTGRKIRTCLRAPCRWWAEHRHDTPPPTAVVAQRQCNHTLYDPPTMATEPLDVVIDGVTLRMLLARDVNNRRESLGTVGCGGRLSPAQRAAVSAHWSAELRAKIATNADLE